jgi:DnaJ-class molecular chaperone
MIEHFYIDEIVKCMECHGRGYVEYPAPRDHNERVKHSCPQCTGTGILHLSGRLNVKAHVPYYYDTKRED